MELSPIKPAHPAMIEAGVVDGIDDALSLVAAIAAPCGRFLDRSWFAAAVPPGRGRTLVAWREERPVIALPVVEGRSGIRMVPGQYWPFRSFPVAQDLGDDEMARFLMARAVRRALGFAWRLGPVYADDPALSVVKRVARASGWTVLERRIASSYRLDFATVRAEGDWPRNSTLRKNRFHEKHLADYGALDWRFVSGRDWSPRVFDDLAAIEAKSWVGKADDADTKFLDPAARAFWERLAEGPEQAARMHAALLTIDGAPAAFSFDLDVGATKYAIANSYDPAFAKHSPGKCLYYRNLVEAGERGISMVDWGAGDSGYKRTIGAVEGPEIIDCLILRGAAGRAIAGIAGGLWKRSGN